MPAFTQGTFTVKTGSLFPALRRMQEEGWIKSAWGESEANRKALRHIDESGIPSRYRAELYELVQDGKDIRQDMSFRWLQGTQRERSIRRGSRARLLLAISCGAWVLWSNGLGGAHNSSRT